MKTERFATEAEACAFAKKMSKKNKTVLSVVESPNPEIPDPSLRFAVDDSGLIRNWERLVATYENGVEE